MKIKVKLLSDNATIPTKLRDSDSGYDLYNTNNQIVIRPFSTVIVPTDVAIELPEGYEAQVRPRSGVSAKTDLIVMLGTIDNEYRGNIGIIVKNMSQYDRFIEPNMKLAQLVPVKIDEFSLELVSELSDTNRADKGFGSSGT